MISLVKKYMEFPCEISPSKLFDEYRNMYQIGDEKYLATCKGSHYIFSSTKIVVVSTISQDYPLDIRDIRRRVRDISNTRSIEKVIKVVFETKIFHRESSLDLERIHFRLAENPPRGIVLNIYEPSISPNLVLKFSAFPDGFTSSFQIGKDGECFVICDTTQSNSSDEVCSERVSDAVNHIQEYL